MPTRWDVVVVGAGPAGCATAYHAARLGYRVALLDRAAFPRPKTCGDGLTPRALRQIEAMGVSLAADRPRIDGLQCVDLDTGRVEQGLIPSQAHGSSAGTVVVRTELDDALRRAAVGAGAVFHAQFDVRGFRQSGHRITGVDAVTAGGPVGLDAHVVVVGEGAAGRLGRRVLLASQDAPTAVAVRQYVRVTGLSSRSFRIYVPLTADGEPIFGYGWVFPVSAELANVGVGWFLPPKDARPGSLARVYDRFLQRLRDTEPCFSALEPCGRLEGGLVPSGMALGTAMAPGALVVGDAARVANPFTGEGIAQALDSGRAAAGALDAHLMHRRQLDVEFHSRMHAAFPDSTTWRGFLPWLAERGRMRASEFMEMMAVPRGVLGRATRRVVLEEPAPGPAIPAPGPAETWSHVRRVLSARHPLLAKLVDAVRADAEVDLDAAVNAFRTAHPGASTAAISAVAVAAVMAVLADEVTPSSTVRRAPAGRSRATWARTALALGAIDLLLAESFTLLVELPPAQALAFSRSVERLIGGLMAADARIEGEKLARWSSTLGKAEARCDPV